MNRTLKSLTLLVLLLLAVTGPVVAQNSMVAEARLDSTTGTDLTVGDPIEVVLSVIHPAGYQVIPPQLEADWGDFTVNAQSALSTAANGDGTETTTMVIDARLFAPGTFTTPALPVSITDGSGDLLQVLAAPTTVSIASILPQGSLALRDIKPQAALPIPANWPWLAGGALVVVAITSLAILFWRRRPATRELIGEPHEVALEALAHVESLRLPEQGRFKEHYALVSEVTRVYLQRRFRIPMLERTTAEVRTSLVTALSESNVSPEVAPRVISLLEESDLVKFSSGMATDGTFLAAGMYAASSHSGLQVDRQAAAQAAMEKARWIINMTKPSTDEAGAGVGSSTSSSGQEHDKHSHDRSSALTPHRAEADLGHPNSRRGEKSRVLPRLDHSKTKEVAP